MLAKTVLLALASFAAVQAFVVPEGTADGIYVTSLDTEGNTVLAPLDDPTGVIARALRGEDGVEARGNLEVDSAKFAKRGPGSKCGTKHNLNHGDCDAAYESLKASCGGGLWVPKNSAISAVRGSVVTYMCTYDNQGGTYTTNDIGNSAGKVTEMCGWYVSGYWNKPGTNLNFGRQPSGTCFCHC